MTENYWYAEEVPPDNEDYDPRAPWRGILQFNTGTVPLGGIWFYSKEDCLNFIRQEILNARLEED